MLHADASPLWAIRLEIGLQYALLIAAMAPLYAAAARLPSPDVFFGVTVDPATPASELGRSIRRQYRRTVYLHSAIGAGLALAATLWTDRAPLWGSVLIGGLIWQAAAANAAYLRARRRVMPARIEPSAVREVSLAPRRIRLPGGWCGQLLALAPLVAATIFLALRWHSIPPVFASHWNAQGQPNGWMHRSAAGVFLLPLCGFWISGIVLGSGYLIAHHTRHPAGAPGLRMARYAELTLQCLVLLEFGTSVLFAAMALWLVPHGTLGPSPAAVGLFLVIPIAGTVVLFAWLGWRTMRLAERMRLELPALADAGGAAAVEGDGTADADWLLGIFYAKRGDPAVLVPKRFGFGYTLNFANPLAWWLLGGCLASSAGFVLVAILCVH